MVDTKPLSQDMAAARGAFGNFRNAHIMGNRILSNAVFLEENKQEPFLLAGFFVKDVATELMRIAAGGKVTTISTAKAAALPFLTEALEPLSTGSVDLETFWQTYEKYANRIRKYGNFDFEDKAYTENKAFTKEATNWLLKYLGREKQILFDSRNAILEGVLNEMGRVYRSHGADTRELVVLALLTYLQRTYAYIRFVFGKPDGSINEEKVRSEIAPYVEFITSTPAEGHQLSEATKKLCKLILAWREYFIRYLELPQPSPVQTERGVELPEETRKKITEAITRSLEK